MDNRKNPIYNASGYKDPTAFLGIRKADKEQEEIDNTAAEAIRLIKKFLGILGFSLIHRIEIRHDKSGREYR